MKRGAITRSGVKFYWLLKLTTGGNAKGSARLVGASGCTTGLGDRLRFSRKICTIRTRLLGVARANPRAAARACCEMIGATV